MAESQDLISHSSLCNICCDVDFHGMFTGRDYRDYADGFSRYRADLDYGRQVPRTWEHIKMNAKCYTDISLGDTHPEPFTRTRPFPDVGEDEMVIAAVEIGTGMFDGEFANCIGFHNGAYRHPRHRSLMIRGLQLCAPERSHSAAWERARQVKEQAESGSGLRANKELSIEFSSCFGGRLAYVQSDCIVSGSSSSDGYAALSYIWGCRLPSTQLKTSKEQELRKPRSLSAPGIILSDIITDAMEFCRQIDLRFLWVDQLCIPQRPGLVDPEIHHMASIYSGATCTLVALSGTTFADPLPGVRPGISHPESQHQAIVDGLWLMTCYPSLFTEIESSVWFSCGWTFQEAAFSKRIFFFTTSQTFFLCRETMYCEESVWEVPDGDSMAAWANTKTIEAGRIKDLMILRNSNESYPEGGNYRSAEEYTKRTLGYPQDILNAWVAVIQWMEEDKKWGSAYCLGLLLDHFGFGLGWQPLHGLDPDPVNQRAGFPSWSCSSFLGPVEWCLEVPSSTRTSGGGRESVWGRSGIIQETDIDITLRERYNRYLSPVRMSQSPFAPQNPILEFKTSAAYITVARKPDGRIVLPTFDIIGNGAYSVGSLQCDPGWRDKQPDRLEFIVFATAKLTDPQPPQYSGYPAGCGTSRYNAKMSGRLFSDQCSYEAAVSRWQDLCSKERSVLDLMCISRGSDGLARRVQVCHGISLDQWLTLEPKEVFVRLG
ncbi:heterokaryon incompatibility protein-domain-containing protein [Fusarium oxysporum Fo47]|nr:heterokaryon incompatibility protein-domain-containing protein [Fusarium oxysporum Fo47]QKD62006.2 heterokaryon incompatibility protein-domain-containing protein [Fusarium oxysporum Fo47]